MDPASPGPTLFKLGNPRLEELNKRYNSPETVELRVREIDARLEELKRQEGELLNERTHLRVLTNRKHNQDERLVPMARLPDEVLQNILYWEHVNLESHRDIPLRNVQLMSVSHHWMRIVFDFAHLWSTIVVALLTRNNPSSSRLEALRERTKNFIDRSKQSKLYISMSPGVTDIVEELLRSCFSRCSRLEVSAFGMAESIRHTNLLTSLKDLTIKAHKKERGLGRFTGPVLLNLHQSGCKLKRLTLLDCEYDATTWPLHVDPTCYTSSLISVTIHASLDPLGVARLLQSCRQLRYVFYTRESLRAREDIAILNSLPSPPPPPPISLPHLESLIMCGEWDILDRLSRLSAPNLRHLEIKPSFQAQPNAPTELPSWLLPSYPPTSRNPNPQPVPRFPLMRILTLKNYAEWAPESFVSLLRLHPELEQVYTNSLQTENLRALSALSQPDVCPRLDTLNLEFYPRAVDEVSLLEMVTRVSSSRRRGVAGATSATTSRALKVKVSGGGWSRMVLDDLRMKMRTSLHLPDSEPMDAKPFEIPPL